MEKNVKLLSIAIPCYNSEAYMRRCIDSLLPGGDEVEILIVDDGSAKDRTGEIADEYEANYPGICRAIHQENGGHGEAVNAGLRAASGVYFKVVDSDDWVNEDAYRQVLEVLRQFVYGDVGDKFCLRKTGRPPQESDAVPDGTSQTGADYLGGCEGIYSGTVYSDAFGGLPDSDAFRL